MNNYRAAVNCDKEAPFLPVMAYVPRQTLTTVYEAERALHCGTLFPELYKPFKGGCRNG